MAAEGRYTADGEESDKFRHAKWIQFDFDHADEWACIAIKSYALAIRSLSRVELFFGCQSTNGRCKNHCGKSYVHKSGGYDSCEMHDAAAAAEEHRRNASSTASVCVSDTSAMRKIACTSQVFRLANSKTHDTNICDARGNNNNFVFDIND